jgi:hypothetical protein
VTWQFCPNESHQKAKDNQIKPPSYPVVCSMLEAFASFTIPSIAFARQSALSIHCTGSLRYQSSVGLLPCDGASRGARGQEVEGSRTTCLVGQMQSCDEMAYGAPICRPSSINSARGLLKCDQHSVFLGSKNIPEESSVVSELRVRVFRSRVF